MVVHELHRPGRAEAPQHVLELRAQHHGLQPRHLVDGLHAIFERKNPITVRVRCVYFLPPEGIARVFVPFGRVRPEKLSLSVRTYPSLGGSTTSANLWYVFLVSCSVASGKQLEEGEAWRERGGVDIDRYTFS